MSFAWEVTQYLKDKEETLWGSEERKIIGLIWDEIYLDLLV